MQMLAAGGIDLVTDDERSADEDNPKGYLELEAVKRLRDGTDWLVAARGKAVKVISHLLPELPTTETYRVVFVKRSLDEILASQAKMIARKGLTAPPEDAVRRAFLSHLKAFDRLAAERADMTVHRLAYAEAIAEPLATAERLAAFVVEGASVVLDVPAMAAAVDPQLYRNRR